MWNEFIKCCSMLLLKGIKYVKLKKAEVTGEQAKSLTIDELKKIPAMKKQMKDAKNQVRRYGGFFEKNTTT